MSCYPFTFVLALLVISQVRAVTRDEKTKQRYFSSDKGKVLSGHVISTHHVSSTLDCSFLCTTTAQCLSYNYKLQGAGDEGLCELNNATRKTKPGAYQNNPQYKHYYEQDSESCESCLDYLRNGATDNGIYTITDSAGDSYKVWCDLSSEPGSAWTLIFSYALKNRKMNAFCKQPLTQNAPVNENTPNWEAYRLSLIRMQRLAIQSTHLRVLSSSAVYGVDFRDYMRVKLSVVNILTFIGSKVCRKVEYVDIRGIKGLDILLPFWQANDFSFSSDSGRKWCEFDGRNGAVNSENNFGALCHDTFNPKFRAYENDDSTTENWFGGYL